MKQGKFKLVKVTKERNRHRGLLYEWKIDPTIWKERGVTGQPGVIS